MKVNTINQRSVDVKNYSFDHKLLALMLSDKRLMYIAAELAVEMFFQKIGIVAIEGEGKCIQKHLESRMSKSFNRSSRGLT